jgi:hypothetical protein
LQRSFPIPRFFAIHLLDLLLRQSAAAAAALMMLFVVSSRATFVTSSQAKLLLKPSVHRAVSFRANVLLLAERLI